MTDIFREVEEDVRRERLEKIWKQYGDYIIAGAAVVIIAIAAFELWQRYEQGQRLKASSEFNQASVAASANPQVGMTAFEQLAANGPSGYAMLARLGQADAALATGDRAKAVALYESVAAENNGPIGNAARVRAAWALADSVSRADLENLLAPLTDPTSPWKYVAREVLAYSDYNNNRMSDAQHGYEALAAASDAPRPLRQRASEMAALIKSGGTGNFGYVPPEAAPPAPGGASGPSPTPQGTPSQ